MLLFTFVNLAAVGLLAGRARAACVSYGVDFQNGGTYFQNISSTDAFTFVQYFEGCQEDVSSNIFIDPTGNEVQCANTSLTPDDTNQMSACFITKSNLFSGAWSIIVASNNGDASPIAYERDFNLVVGVPTTITIYPTVTVTSTSTPSKVRSRTTTSTGTTTATRTVTYPAVTLSPTTTITPAAVTATSTSFTSTTTALGFTAEPIITTITYTKTCSIAPSQSSPDPTASVSPTLLAKREVPHIRQAAHIIRDLESARADREAWLESRRERLGEAAAVEKRGLDRASTTITETDPANFKTSTLVVTAKTTVTTTTTIETVVYSTTYTTSTDRYGTTTLAQATVTAPTPTSTKTTNAVTTTTSTVTQKPLVTIITSTAPAASSSACSSLGGKLV